MNDMLLVIMLAGRRAVLPAIVVNSVIELAEVTPVPRAAAHVAGLAALRSRPLTLIDCRLSLDAGREPTDPRTCRAVVVEHEGHLYGLLVEAADTPTLGWADCNDGFLCATAEVPLDYNRPLWHFHVVENFGEGGAIIGRLHHCIGDGIALVQVLLGMTDEEPNPLPERRKARELLAKLALKTP